MASAADATAKTLRGEGGRSTSTNHRGPGSVPLREAGVIMSPGTPRGSQSFKRTARTPTAVTRVMSPTLYEVQAVPDASEQCQQGVTSGPLSLVGGQPSIGGRPAVGG